MKTQHPIILLASLAAATAQFTTPSPSRTQVETETAAPPGIITPAPSASAGPAAGPPEQTFSNERLGRLLPGLGRDRLDRDGDRPGLGRDRLDRDGDRLDRERERLDRARERLEREREERDRQDRDRLDRARERLDREREERERPDREREGREREGREREGREREGREREGREREGRERERPGRERPGDEFLIKPPPGADVTITTAINPTRAGSGAEAAATALNYAESGGNRKTETPSKDVQGGASRYGPGVYVATLGLAIGVVVVLV